MDKDATDDDLAWRIARAYHDKAEDSAEAAADARLKEKLLREGLGVAQASMERTRSGYALKWYAILLSGVGQFSGTSATIKNSFIVREHFEKACKFDPKDATSRHLLGLWCFEVAKLSWIEQKAAAALFATPPTATFAEALDHFEHAERIEPGFYPKNLLLTAQALSRLGRADEAKAALAKCLAATPKSPEDEATIEEARKLKL